MENNKPVAIATTVTIASTALHKQAVAEMEAKGIKAVQENQKSWDNLRKAFSWSK